MRKALLVVAIVVVAGACASSGDDSQTAVTDAPDPTTTETTLAEVPCVDEVRRSTDSLPPESPMAAADALVITAINESGCAPLDEPLVAFNWFSFDDRAAYGQYSAGVSQVLVEQGHWPVMGAATVEVLETPDGSPEGGGAYVHEEFSFPIYSSAGGFLDMLLSPEYQAIFANQQEGARSEDYVWGLQECLVGCPETQPTPVGEGLFVLHVFDRPAGDLAEALPALATAPDGPDVFYGGELVATLEIHAGENVIRPQIPPWGNGTAVYRVDSPADAEALLTNEALVSFREGTTDDVLAVVQAGGL